MSPDPHIAEALAAFQGGDLDRAERIAETQLAVTPESPPLLHLLGLIDCRQGRMDSGVERLRRAAAAEPDNAVFRVMLVRALVDVGRAGEALELALPPPGTSPPELTLWHARAEAADVSGEHEASAAAWQVIASARPADWRAWSNLGNALAALERWPDAAQALRRAAHLNPEELPIRRNFASALARAGFYEESADQLRRMLDFGHDDTGIRLMLARLYADLGRQEDSMAELDKAARAVVGEQASGHGSTGLIRIALGDKALDGADPASISPADLRSLRELALLLERTNRLDALGNLLGDAERLGIGHEQLGYPAAAVALREGDPEKAMQLLLTESPEDDPVRWHRLMAKIADSAGDPDAAFAAAESMNRSVPEFDRWRARGVDYRRRLRNLASVITPRWAEQLRPLDPGSRRSPAFLVGFPRSGTTLLDTFLMGHPDIQVLEEFHMLGAAETVVGNVVTLPQRTQRQLEQARRAYFAELDQHADPGFPGLVVDKLPLNMLGLAVIYSLFPDARIIFAQRHPCDTVLSGFMQSFTLNDAMACFLTIGDAADLYDAAMAVFARGRESLPLEVHTLVYEELVVEPEAALRPLIAFLGLEWRDELLDHRSTAKARGAIITPSYDQVTQSLSKAPSGRWRRYEKQLEPVLPALLPWAERLGYRD